MVKELVICEEELLTEVAVWMWQNLTIPVIANISEFDMFSKEFDMIETLLTDEHCSAFQANFAESLVMVCFQMPLERSNIWKLLVRVRAIVDDASQVTERQAAFLGRIIVIVHSVVLRVLLTPFLKLLVKEAPSQISI